MVEWREHRLGYIIYLILVIVILVFSLIAMILSKKKKSNDEQVLVPEEDLEKFIRRSFKINHTENA
jgi:heme/copper-type cytochrome/quinol oxidase subunit 2